MTFTCCKFEFSRNFAGFRRFGSQQRLNELDTALLSARVLQSTLFNGV